MEKPVFADKFDWHGCEVVEFDPEKLGGRAAVKDSRVFADGILVNFESGMSVEELEENFGVEREAIEAILAFAASRQMMATA